MNYKIESFLKKHEIIILIFLLVMVIFVNSQGITWGLPGFWNPDELVQDVKWVLDGANKFDPNDLNYPSLPKYFMLFWGRLSDALSFPRVSFFITARFFSVLLGAFVTWAVYGIVRNAGGSYGSAFFSALLVAVNNQIALHSHFAHNDLYVTYFVCLGVYFLVRFNNSKNKWWLYLSFFASGLAASSKYPGGILFVVIFLTYIITERRNILRDKIGTFETVFVGTSVSIIGYGVGTPQLITWFSFYITRLIPALLNHATYAATPTSKLGFFTQWGVLRHALGNFEYCISILSIIVISVFIVLKFQKKIKIENVNISNHIIILGSIVALDIPIMISYNVQPRFLLPIIPLLSVVIGLSIDYISRIVLNHKNSKILYSISLVPLLLIIMSTVRQASVIMVIKNDSRIEAGEFISTLPEGSSMEITWYTPNIDEYKYEVSQYPLYFLKHEGEALPIDSRFEYNTGERGVEDRKPDYLIISSFIYDRFENEYICKDYEEDCDFFHDLKSGKTNYSNIGSYKYDLPNIFTKPSITFMNPEIQIYERIE